MARAKLEVPAVGSKWSRWTVLENLGSIGGNYKSKVLCDCGTVKTVVDNSLRSGVSSSCGCLRREVMALEKRSHGMTGTPEYIVWGEMVQRCTNPTNPSYKWYGGVGITVCEDWLEFSNFYRDMGTRPDSTMQLDREDNSKGYGPDNCRWATQIENANNKSNNTKFPYLGELYTARELSEITGIKMTLLHSRLFVNKMDVEKAIELGVEDARVHNKGRIKNDTNNQTT